jgi:hypothetical protein
MGALICDVISLQQNFGYEMAECLCKQALTSWFLSCLGLFEYNLYLRTGGTSSLWASSSLFLPKIKPSTNICTTILDLMVLQKITLKCQFGLAPSWVTNPFSA